MKNFVADIAVIIPTYHAHKTIKRTLCSLASQFGVSFKVYLVVDGESIGSYDYLLDMFDDKMFHLEILYKKENGGPGMARQYAIDNTSEPFLTFIDSDDILHNVNSLYTMRMAFEEQDVLVITPFYKQMEDGSFILKETSPFTWMHGKMYRRSFIDKYGIHFNKDYPSANEDMGFNSMIGLIADCQHERIKQLDNEYVTYVQLSYEGSITRKNNKEFTRLGKNVEGFVYNKLHALEYVIDGLNMFNNDIAQVAARALPHIYVNYVGINLSVEGFKEKVDDLALINYIETKKYTACLSEEKIEEIEKDTIQVAGYSYSAYKQWKESIVLGGSVNYEN